jgi:hypothetical protein
VRAPLFPYLPKDFIETREGLIFAVVSYFPHEDKVGCFLRYVRDDRGWHKVDTEQANRLLSKHYPHYLFQSKQFDAHFHAVAVEDIIQHHRPEVRLQTLLNDKAITDDAITIKCVSLMRILDQFGAPIEKMGLTGSMLIGQQKAGSDIDLAIYGRRAFSQTRAAVKQAVSSGLIDPLDLDLMRENFERRASELSFEEFSWHESRKFNKAAIEGTKFDIGMVCLPEELEQDHHHYVKKGTSVIEAKVINDDRAFDFPAYYVIDNPTTPVVISYTHTYVGQAVTGEKIRVSGAVEYDTATGQRRLVVGSSREAAGEYIKVSKENE